MGVNPEAKIRNVGTAAGLKGLSHDIFGPVFWTVCMHLGLNVNRFWFLNLYISSST